MLGLLVEFAPILPCPASMRADFWSSSAMERRKRLPVQPLRDRRRRRSAAWWMAGAAPPAGSDSPFRYTLRSFQGFQSCIRLFRYVNFGVIDR